MKHVRRSILALAASLALAGALRPAHAEDSPTTAAQPAEKAAAAVPMEGCKADGSCCGNHSCQQQEMAAQDSGGGCPCQRAKRAAEAAAAAQQKKE